MSDGKQDSGKRDAALQGHEGREEAAPPPALEQSPKF